MESITNKYDVLIEDNQTTIKQHYDSIIQFKKSEAKINLLISLTQTEEQEKQELQAMKDSIQAALKDELATLRAKQKKIDAYSLSLELLTNADCGKLAKCYLEDEQKWKNSKVLEVNLQEQTAKIKRYGSNAILEFPAYYLKVLKEPNPQLFKEGSHCKSIYSGDGQFYPCILEKITEQGYHVRYKKYNSEEIVELHRLRVIKNSEQKNEDIKFSDLHELKIPEKLKIQPNDPENVKKNKKIKIKALKFQFKNAQIEEVNKQKQQKWKDWNCSGSRLGNGYFKTKHEMSILTGKKQ